MVGHGGAPGVSSLASAFGIYFGSSSAAKPYQVREHPVTGGISQFVVGNQAAGSSTLEFSIPCDESAINVRFVQQLMNWLGPRNRSPDCRAKAL